MHGRLKVKTTDEQKEEKRIEREQKAQKFKKIHSVIFAKRQHNQLDDEILQLTEKVLSALPDVYSLWNIRKETILLFKDTRDKDEIDKLLLTELGFLQKCLLVNPKSYSVWLHRVFVMETLSEPNWKEELKLCTKFLSYDSRNFHCWDYRRYVAKMSNVSLTDELDYTMVKIEENFSNYSAWHYRSKLLPSIHPSSERKHKRMTEEVLLAEMDLVQNAFFTDPNDQSAWFYERWLLGKEGSSTNLLSVTAERNNSEFALMVSFSKPQKCVSGEVNINDESVSGSWTNNQSQSSSYTWIYNCKLPSAIMDHTSLVVTVDFGNLGINQEITIAKDNNESYINLFAESSSLRFSDVHSETKSTVFASQLESLSMLLEEEPDNKWTLLTMVQLMKAINHIAYKTEMDDMIERLIKTDPYRTAYYKDLNSKLNIEYVIEKKCIEKLDFTDVSLMGQGLTCLRHTSYFLTCKHLNISNNALNSLHGVAELQNVEVIIADGNQLKNLDGLGCLPKLHSLSVKNNCILSVVLKRAKCIFSISGKTTQ